MWVFSINILESTGQCNYDNFLPTSSRGPGTGPIWDSGIISIFIPVLSIFKLGREENQYINTLKDFQVARAIDSYLREGSANFEDF